MWKANGLLAKARDFPAVGEHGLELVGAGEHEQGSEGLLVRLCRVVGSGYGAKCRQCKPGKADKGNQDNDVWRGKASRVQFSGDRCS